MAFVSAWIDRLPQDCDLNHMAMKADGCACRLSYIGEPEKDGVTQVNAALPEGLRTGLVPIELTWLGRPLSAPGWMRIIPAGPSVPRIGSLTDGVNLLSDNRITSGILKVTMHEVIEPGHLRVAVDGKSAVISDAFCVDPIAQRWEFNVDLPPETGGGAHEVRIAMGNRDFPPMAIEVQ